MEVDKIIIYIFINAVVDWVELIAVWYSLNA